MTTSVSSSFREALAAKPGVPNGVEAVADLVRVGDGIAVAAAVHDALHLLDDPDPSVRRGAVDVLHLGRRHVDASLLAEALVAAWDGVDETGADALLLLADIVRESDGDALDLVLEWLDDPRLRGRLLGRLARSVPEVLARDATRLLRPSDAPVLLRLPAPEHRAQVANAIGPWEEHHVDFLLEAQRARPIPHEELALLLDLLATQPVTHPSTQPSTQPR